MSLMFSLTRAKRIEQFMSGIFVSSPLNGLRPTFFLDWVSNFAASQMPQQFQRESRKASREGVLYCPCRRKAQRICLTQTSGATREFYLRSRSLPIRGRDHDNHRNIPVPKRWQVL